MVRELSPSGLSEVLAAPLRPGRLEDIGHVVILVRENGLAVDGSRAVGRTSPRPCPSEAGGPSTGGALLTGAVLASAFTVCEAYYAPVRDAFGTGPDTDPGAGSGPGPASGAGADVVLAGGPWAGYAERLGRAGVGLRTYSASAVEEFVADVASDRLPQVSWIVAPPAPPTPACPPGPPVEHAVMAALAARPEVWARSVFLLTCDDDYGPHGPGWGDSGRGGGGGDTWPEPEPLPPLAEGRGRSTVCTDGEFVVRVVRADGGTGQRVVDRRGRYQVPDADGELCWSETLPAGETRVSEPAPVGLGRRVPLVVASPWTLGGVVDSTVLDHSSLVRFLERRFGVREPGIGAWRREVTGDLLSVFDFVAESGGLPPVPLVQGGAAEGRTWPARPLPYALTLQSRVRDGRLELSMRNDGSQGAVVHAHPRPGDVTHHYTVGARSTLTGACPLGAEGFDLRARGPAGFRWHLRGRDSVLEATLQTVERVDLEQQFGPPRPTEYELRVRLANRGPRARTFLVGDLAYGAGVREVRVAAHTTRAMPLPVPGHGWYDVAVTVADEPYFLRRAAGRLPAAGTGVTDPARGMPRALTAQAELAGEETDMGSAADSVTVTATATATTTAPDAAAVPRLVPGRPRRLTVRMAATEPTTVLSLRVVAPKGWRSRQLTPPVEVGGTEAELTGEADSTDTTAVDEADGTDSTTTREAEDGTGTAATRVWEVTPPDDARDTGPHRLLVLCVGRTAQRLVLAETELVVRTADLLATEATITEAATADLTTPDLTTAKTPPA